jgi:hypothetical protein
MVWNKIFTDSLLGYISKGLQNRYPHCHAKYCNGYYEAGKAGYFPSLSVGNWTHQMLSKNSQFEHSFKIGVQINTN